MEIAKYLNVTVEYLVTGKDQNPDIEFCNKYFQYEKLLEKYSLLSPANKRLIESSINNLIEK